jgi:dihydroorotate dehydrogenase (fumarate)
MADLTTRYLGLELKNPVIVSSSGLTNSVEKIQQAEENGAAAVVLKSMFEEQLNVDAGKSVAGQGLDDFPEARMQMETYAKDNSVNDYLELIKNSKAEVNIPVIASINCIGTTIKWFDFAARIEDAGADAIELNVNVVPTDRGRDSLFYEQIYYEIIDKVKETVKIPVAIKIGPHFTNILNVVQNLFYKHKVDGVVLFNKFYEPDIDIKKEEFTSAEIFSAPKDVSLPLRWIGLLAGDLKRFDISASTGIHDGEAAIKLLLAGAKTVQVCSSLYKNGIQYVKEIVDFVEKWPEEKGYKSIDDFRGKMSYNRKDEAQQYERSQFMRYYSSRE